MNDREPSGERPPPLPGHATIRCRLDGPLVVELPEDVRLRIVDHLGGEFRVPPGKAAVALCRCGQSGSRPFCDGTHRRCGFSARETGPAPG